MVKKEFIIGLLVISMFLISACDVYKTLYVKEAGEEEEGVEVPEDAITIEIEEGMEEVPSLEEIDIEDMFQEEEEVADEEEIPEDTNVIIVDETELVSLVPKAEDPDADVLTFAFTSPLDENGEWQTTYGDAGEYTVTVTASDGLLTSSKEVLVIVNKKEEMPSIDSFNPKETVLEIDETDTLSFDVTASDLNNDELAYAWKLDGISIGNKNSIKYQSTYEDSGSHTVKVIVSDGTFETEKIWSITVNNVNRNPVLSKVNDIKAKEKDAIIVQLEATDEDGDELSFDIDDERFVQDGNLFTWETSYDDAGEYSFTATVSDGVGGTASQEFTVTVEDVNRAPVILDIVQKQ
jgi:PKD repeat protein